MEAPPANLTPMMRQWTELKTQAGSALLFFRLGDFYELFEDDAIKGAPVLQVVLTSRNKNTNSSPLCGVPVGNIEVYLSRALDHGFKVALAEQTEEPQPGKVLVRREIVQWFTPGIRLLRNEERPHYAAVLAGSLQSWSIAAADVGTGHLVLESGSSLEALPGLCVTRRASIAPWPCRAPSNRASHGSSRAPVRRRRSTSRCRSRCRTAWRG